MRLAAQEQYRGKASATHNLMPSLPIVFIALPNMRLYRRLSSAVGLEDYVYAWPRWTRTGKFGGLQQVANLDIRLRQ
jgi:hypothetical protein